MRTTSITRETSETKISITLCLDGCGKSNINTGCGFLDHMLTLFSKHARFDLELSCVGDTCVDFHHTAEDIGICLGQAFDKALNDKKGINRYSSIILPMDEALVLCAVDLSGRGHLEYSLDIPSEKVGSFDTELVKEFWLAFIRNSNCTLHLRQLSGENSHHIIEAAFKAVARSLKEAASVDKDFPNELPTTKGVL